MENKDVVLELYYVPREGLAEQFKAQFGVNLLTYYNHVSGFNIVEFDRLVNPPDGVSLKNHLTPIQADLIEAIFTYDFRYMRFSPAAEAENLPELPPGFIYVTFENELAGRTLRYKSIVKKPALVVLDYVALCSMDYSRGYTITHLPSGRLITLATNKQKATKLLKDLNSVPGIEVSELTAGTFIDIGAVLNK